jgi:hypothetical protein
MNDQRGTLWVLMSTSVLASSLSLACGPSPGAGSAHVVGGAAATPLDTSNGGDLLPPNPVESAADGGAWTDSGALDDSAPAPTTISAPAAHGPASASPDAATTAAAETGVPAVAASPVVTRRAAMPLISQGLPAYANYAQSPASNAVDSDYSTAWRTGHDPSMADSNWLAIDLSTVPAAQRTTVYAVWFNEYGYNYDTSDGSSYTLPGDFEVQGSPTAGGGQPPSAGWVTLASTKGNTLSSGANLLNLQGYNWLRFNCTASASNVAS